MAAVTVGIHRRLQAVGVVLAFIGLVLASMPSSALPPGPDSALSGKVEHAHRGHGDHAGLTTMAGGREAGLDAPLPCPHENGVGGSNCCIGTVCPMIAAMLGPAQAAAEAWWITPPSFVWPIVVLPADSRHATIFRPPIPSV